MSLTLAEISDGIGTITLNYEIKRSLSPADFERIQGLRRVVYNSRDYAEGINAFKEQSKPVYLGK